MFINMVTVDKFSKPKLKETLKYSLLSKETHGKESKMGALGGLCQQEHLEHPPSPCPRPRPHRVVPPAPLPFFR